MPDLRAILSPPKVPNPNLRIPHLTPQNNPLSVTTVATQPPQSNTSNTFQTRTTFSTKTAPLSTNFPSTHNYSVSRALCLLCCWGGRLGLLLSGHLKGFVPVMHIVVFLCIVSMGSNTTRKIIDVCFQRIFMSKLRVCFQIECNNYSNNGVIKIVRPNLYLRLPKSTWEKLQHLQRIQVLFFNSRIDYKYFYRTNKINKSIISLITNIKD